MSVSGGLGAVAAVQGLALEALGLVLDIARRESVTLFLRGGSALGAAKYGGFVPWDDDIDLACPRPDFARFAAALAAGLPRDRFRLARRGDPDFFSYTPKVLLAEGVRTRRGLPRNQTLGLSLIDLLPLDGAPAAAPARSAYLARVFFWRTVAASWTVVLEPTLTYHSHAAARLAGAAGRLGLRRLASQPQAFARLERLYTSVPLAGASWSGTVTGSLFARELFPSEVWGEGRQAAFAGLTCLVPAQTDRYLRQLYGRDYLTAEPAARKSHLGAP